MIFVFYANRSSIQSKPNKIKKQLYHELGLILGLSDLARRIDLLTRRRGTIGLLRRRLSVAVQLGNAACVMEAHGRSQLLAPIALPPLALDSLPSLAAALTASV